MSAPYSIRPEEPRDYASIYDLTKRAFAPMPFAGGDEQDLIDALRRAGALALSLVAEQQSAIVGHVALSPVTHESGEDGWFGLGPISVEPALQRQGLGGALIAEAKTRLKARGARDHSRLRPGLSQRTRLPPRSRACAGEGRGALFHGGGAV